MKEGCLRDMLKRFCSKITQISDITARVILSKVKEEQGGFIDLESLKFI